MKTYETYKDSGVQWIGEIPSHWELLNLRKKPFNFEVGKREQTKLKEVVSIGGEHIQEERFFLDNLKYVSLEFFENAKNGKIKKGDILLVKDGATIGKAMFVNSLPFEKMMLNEHVYKIESKKFFYYIIQSAETQYQFWKNNQSSAQESITSNTLKSFVFCWPNEKEQIAIAEYLDKKTAEIDQLIAEKKQLVELYKEEKTALINQAVTKGVKPNVKLKESGIEWLGDIPEHWVIKKLNWCFKTIGSGTTPKTGNQDYYFNGTHNWLLTGDLNDGEIHKTTKKITDKALNDYSSLKEYEKNSVVIAMYGATIGKLGVLKIPTTVNQACCVLSEPTHLNYDFTFFLLLSARQEIINMSYGGGQPNISQELLKQFKIQVPPKEEQTEIIQHIEKESERIDAKIAKAEQYINLLTEYRTALISEVVTGKIKVID
jgi:type I restriction enzyme S subunit